MAGFEYNALIPLNLQKRAKDVDPSQFATAEQGELADTALQAINNGTNGDYITITIGGKINNMQAISASLVIVDIPTATAEANGLATSYNVRQRFYHLVRAGLTSSNITNNHGVWRGPSSVWNVSSYKMYGAEASLVDPSTYPYSSYNLIAIPCYETVANNKRQCYYIYDVINQIPVVNTSVKVQAWGFNLEAFN